MHASSTCKCLVAVVEAAIQQRRSHVNDSSVYFDIMHAGSTCLQYSRLGLQSFNTICEGQQL